MPDTVSGYTNATKLATRDGQQIQSVEHDRCWPAMTALAHYMKKGMLGMREDVMRGGLRRISANAADSLDEKTSES